MYILFDLSSDINDGEGYASCAYIPMGFCLEKCQDTSFILVLSCIKIMKQKCRLFYQRLSTLYGISPEFIHHMGYQSVRCKRLNYV